MNGTTRIGIRNEAIICGHCDSTEGPFRETFHGSAICVDSEQCATRWMRRFGHFDVQYADGKRCWCDGRKHTCPRFAGALVTVRED